ncbi:alpha/beta hydrolase [Pseudomonas mucidolens]|uniref:alpha/beta hydrolase n=1 Tax=Pseudomonas mucidolens TaxID=46679 RepID=UPI000A05B04C
MDAAKLLDPAYAHFLEKTSSEWTLAGLPAIRTRASANFKPPQLARCEQRWTTDAPNTPGVRLCIYRPDQKYEDQALPAILYLHGGGFVLGCPEMADDYLTDLAIEMKAVIVAVDYRLAPEHPFPIPLEDCYTALSWLLRESPSLGVDADRVVIMGHSAGGGLAAALALLVRERAEHSVVGLVLVYPMLDHRTGSANAPTDNPTTGTLNWGSEANQFCWHCMQGSYTFDDEQAFLFSAALASDLRGLPRSFICVGTLDLFLVEDVDFALKLSRSGVPIELHVYPGVPHMFDQYPGSVTDQCRNDVVAALRKMIGG